MARFRGQSGSQGWRKSSSTGGGGSATEVQIDEGEGVTFTNPSASVFYLKVAQNFDVQLGQVSVFGTATLPSSGATPGATGTLVVDASANSSGPVGYVVTVNGFEINVQPIDAPTCIPLVVDESGAWQLAQPSPFVEVQTDTGAGTTFTSQGPYQLVLEEGATGVVDLPNPNFNGQASYLFVVNNTVTTSLSGAVSGMAKGNEPALISILGCFGSWQLNYIINYGIYSDDEGVLTVANLIVSSIAASDPHVAGKLYNVAGVVHISAG